MQMQIPRFHTDDLFRSSPKDNRRQSNSAGYWPLFLEEDVAVDFLNFIDHFVNHKYQFNCIVFGRQQNQNKYIYFN